MMKDARSGLPALCLKWTTPLPRGRAVEGAPQVDPAGVPAPHLRSAVGPLQQDIHRRQQELQGVGGERQGDALHDGLLVLHGHQGAVVNAMAQVPRRPARETELVHHLFQRHRGNVPHDVEPEAVHGSLHRGVDGEEVDGVGREEGRGVGGNPGRSKRRTVHGRYEGWELGVGHSNPWRQVLGRGVEQGVHQPGLAAVHVLQTVQSNVGYTQVGPLDAVADALQGGESLAEYPPVGLSVRFQDHGVCLAGQGLLKGHSRSNAPARGKMVYYDRPWPGTVHDDGGPVSQAGMAPNLYLGPQVGDENTGYLQDSSRDALLGWCGSAS